VCLLALTVLTHRLLPDVSKPDEGQSL
jgi:hypothetical protein